jgi:hypothetical protein
MSRPLNRLGNDAGSIGDDRHWLQGSVVGDDQNIHILHFTTNLAEDFTDA